MVGGLLVRGLGVGGLVVRRLVVDGLVVRRLVVDGLLVVNGLRAMVDWCTVRDSVTRGLLTLSKRSFVNVVNIIRTLTTITFQGRCSRAMGRSWCAGTVTCLGSRAVRLCTAAMACLGTSTVRGCTATITAL